MVTYVGADPKFFAGQHASRPPFCPHPTGCFCSHHNTRASSTDMRAPFSRRSGHKLPHNYTQMATCLMNQARKVQLLWGDQEFARER